MIIQNDFNRLKETKHHKAKLLELFQNEKKEMNDKDEEKKAT